MASCMLFIRIGRKEILVNLVHFARIGVKRWINLFLILITIKLFTRHSSKYKNAVRSVLHILKHDSLAALINLHSIWYSENPLRDLIEVDHFDSDTFQVFIWNHEGVKMKFFHRWIILGVVAKKVCIVKTKLSRNSMQCSYEMFL